MPKTILDVELPGRRRVVISDPEFSDGSRDLIIFWGEQQGPGGVTLNYSTPPIPGWVVWAILDRAQDANPDGAT